MTIEELKTKVVTVIAEQLQKKVEEVKPELKVVEDLKVDELDYVEIIMTLEEEFGIEIPDEDLDKITTVEDLIAYVYSKLPDDKKTEPKPDDDKKGDK
jgi:acyl carrier protein